MNSSPFLHREQRRADWYVPVAAPRQQLAWERMKARMTLDKLLCRKWERENRFAHVMQRLGDWGRKYFVWVKAIRWWM